MTTIMGKYALHSLLLPLLLAAAMEAPAQGTTSRFKSVVDVAGSRYRRAFTRR